MYKALIVLASLALTAFTTNAAPTAAFPDNCGALPKQDFKKFVDFVNDYRKKDKYPEFQLTTELTKVSFHHVNNLECSDDFAETTGCSDIDPHLGWRGDAAAASNPCQKEDGKSLGCCGKSPTECTSKKLKDTSDNGDHRVVATAYDGSVLDQIVLWNSAAISSRNQAALKTKVTEYFKGEQGKNSPTITATTVKLGVGMTGNYLVLIAGTTDGSGGVCPTSRALRNATLEDISEYNRDLAMAAPAPSCGGTSATTFLKQIAGVVNAARKKGSKTPVGLSVDLFTAAHFKAANLAATATGGGCKVPVGASSKDNCANDLRSWKTGEKCFPKDITPPAACCESNPANTKPCWDGKFALFNTKVKSGEHGNFMVVAGTKLKAETPKQVVDRLMLTKYGYQTLIANTNFRQIGGYMSDTHYSFMIAKSAVKPATACVFKAPGNQKPRPTSPPEKTTSDSFKFSLFAAFSVLMAALL